MKKRFISLFLVAALCLSLLPTTALAEVVVVPSPGGGDGDISVDVNPDEPGNVTVIVPGQDGGDIVVVIPPEEEPEPPAIGDVVNFAGHEWYIIGTMRPRASPPRRAATPCLPKTTTSAPPRSGPRKTEGTTKNSTAYNYKDSGLHNSN